MVQITRTRPDSRCSSRCLTTTPIPCTLWKPSSQAGISCMVVVPIITGRLGRIRRRAEARTRQTGVYFTQPPLRTPFARVLVPGSGMPKQKNALLKRPHTSLSQHRTAARRRPPGGGVHHHTTTPPRQRGGRRTPRGRDPPNGGTACFERPYTSAIGACLVSFFVVHSSSSSVVSGQSVVVVVLGAVHDT